MNVRWDKSRRRPCHYPKRGLYDNDSDLHNEPLRNWWLASTLLSNFLHNSPFPFFAGYYMNLNQNPHTLLPKFFGMYVYQCNQKNIRIIVMNNLLPSNIKMHLKFDLKGSTFKRKVSFISPSSSADHSVFADNIGNISLEMWKKYLNSFFSSNIWWTIFFSFFHLGK